MYVDDIVSFVVASDVTVHHVVLRTCVPTYILGQRLISSFLFFICFLCIASITLLYTIYIYTIYYNTYITIYYNTYITIYYNTYMYLFVGLNM